MKKIHTEFPQLLNNKKKILLLGKNSTLCKNFLTRIDKEKFDIFLYGKKNINFLNKKDDKKLHQILKRIQPDIIINFIGKFELNSRSNMDLFKINISPTWELISFYLKKKNDKKIKLLIIGSSSQSSPRKKYMLYAASKTALNNLVRSAKENFKNSKVDIKILNPRTFGGKHLKHFKKVINEDVNKVAKLIYRYISH